MTLAAFLPEIAAAAVALFAVRAGDKLRLPFAERSNCEEAQQKAVVWSYDARGAAVNTLRPVVRDGSCTC